MADEPTAPKTEAAVSGAPSTWPGAFGSYKYSKAAVMVNVWTLIGIWLAVAVIGSILQRISPSVGGLLASLVDVVGTTAGILVLLAGVRGQKLAFSDAISQAFPFFLKMNGLGIVVVVTLIVSLLLLVIPFFFVLPRVSLAHYFLIDKDMGVMDAFKASWDATKGSAGKVWGIIGVTILMALLMITIIGIPFSIYFLIMYSGAYAVLYAFLNKTQPAAAPAAKAPAAPVTA